MGCVTNNYNSRSVKAPLENKSTKLKYQLAIYVPSTDFEKTTTSPIYQKRVKTTEKFLSSNFDGDTSIRAKGGYIFDDPKDKKNFGKLGTEKVTIVETSMTKADYLKNKPKIEKFIKEKKVTWKQESVMFTFEGDHYIYPAFDKK